MKRKSENLAHILGYQTGAVTKTPPGTSTGVTWLLLVQVFF